MNVPISKSRQPRTERQWLLPSRLEAVHGVCKEAGQWVDEQGLSSDRFFIDLILRECINNSIVHAHARDPSKWVRVHLRLRPKGLLIRVADQGGGFDWNTVWGQTTGDTATSGRGLPVMKMYSDWVRFNRAGNVVTLRVKKEITDE